MGIVRITDRKGKVKVFASNERSGGTVSSIYHRPPPGSKPKPKKEKPFVAQIVPFEPDYIPPLKEAIILP